MIYLSITDLVTINKVFSSGIVVNSNSLHYLIEIVEDDFRYSDEKAKAAVYFYNTITRHMFLDGNKRTAVASMILFLNLNCVSFKISHSDLKQLALRVASGIGSFDEVLGSI